MSYSTERVLVYYQIPNGSVIRVDDSAAKGAPTIGYTMQGGEVVTATRVSVTPVTAPSELERSIAAAFELGHRCCERGMNIQAARIELARVMSTPA